MPFEGARFFALLQILEGKMYPIVNSQEMKTYDSNTIQYFGVPSLVLMERAALACVEVIEARISKGRVLIVAGVGNNGGDGIAIGRILHTRGYDVEIALIGKREKLSDETKTQETIAKAYGIAFIEKISLKTYDVIVDSLFGIGMNRNVEGIYKETIEVINQMNGFILSVDMPSGIHTDTGCVLGCGVKADCTVTFAFKKLGLVLYPGTEYAGEVVVSDIGITEESFLDCQPDAFGMTKKDVAACLVPRKNRSNKGSYGRIVVVAGSINMAGAAYFAGLAAYRGGAGLVEIVTCEENRTILQERLPAAVLTTYTDNYMEVLKSAMKRATVLVAGPGMGMSQRTEDMTQYILEYAEVPVILDADSINVLANHVEWLREKRCPLVLTPHLKEFAKLLGKETKKVVSNYVEEAREFAAQYNVVLVAKDARTVVAKSDKSYYINEYGNNGMAVGGSGDTLTGLIGALAAQGTDMFLSAAAGVSIHAMAGDIAVASVGEDSLMPEDILRAVPQIFIELRRSAEKS